MADKAERNETVVADAHEQAAQAALDLFPMLPEQRVSIQLDGAEEAYVGRRTGEEELLIAMYGANRVLAVHERTVYDVPLGGKLPDYVLVDIVRDGFDPGRYDARRLDLAEVSELNDTFRRMAGTFDIPTWNGRTYEDLS